MISRPITPRPATSFPTCRLSQAHPRQRDSRSATAMGGYEVQFLGFALRFGVVRETSAGVDLAARFTLHYEDVVSGRLFSLSP